MEWPWRKYGMAVTEICNGNVGLEIYIEKLWWKYGTVLAEIWTSHVGNIEWPLRKYGSVVAKEIWNGNGGNME